MILSMSAQAEIFLVTAAVGFALGFFYDVFRVLRRVLSHGNFATQAEDIMFWLAASAYMFYILMYVTDGELRAYHLLGACLGMALYFSALSVIVIALSLKAAGFIALVFRITVNILLTPFILLHRLILIPVGFLKPRAKKFRTAAKNRLYKYRKYVKLKSGKFIHEMKVIVKKT